ncbi:MAG: glycosyltransferase family 39 protein [Dehalococcoidia bacterium]
MIAPATRARTAIGRSFAAHPLALDAALILAVTAVAAVLRLVKLGQIPYGVHSDEAQVGTDAHRILSEGWIGVYTHAALGQPSGHAYLTMPSIWLLGDTAFALRLPLALVALAAVPLLYLLVRVSFRRTEAFFAAALLAVSYWHLFYSRVAHWSISYGTVLLAVLLCIMLGLRSGRWWWYLAAGVLLGLGIYTYNIYPIAVLAVAAFLAIMTVRVLLADRRRGDAADSPAAGQSSLAPPASSVAPLRLPARRAWFGSLALLWAAAFIVALPMLVYLSNPDAYYWQHFNNYEGVRITRTPEFARAGTWGRIELIAGQAKFFASAYAWAGRKDYVDGNGLRPVFDPLTLLLIAGGIVLAWRYRREPMVVAALCGFAIVPLPAVLQQGSIMREPVAAAPYAMFLAALPLAALWRAATRVRGWVRFVPAAAACFALAVIGAITVHDYFWTLRTDPWIRTIYFSQMTSASEYMRRLPAGTYVYFYSDRAPLSLETRQFLAPDIKGEDRSAEFAGVESIPASPRRPSAFVLLGPYEELLPQIEARFPGGRARVVMRDGKFEFAAYELPARR